MEYVEICIVMVLIQHLIVYIYIYIYIKNPPIHASDSQLAFILIRVLNHHATYVQCQCHYRRVSIGTLEDGEIHLSNRQDVWDVPLKIPTSDGV